MNMVSEAPFQSDDVARLLDRHIKSSTKSGPVTFAIDKLLVNRVEGKEASLDVYYTVSYADKTLPGIMKIDYEEFRRETGGFQQLFEYMAKGLFDKMKGAR